MSKFIVTIAPPTPNGNLHLGHLSGPFLSADVFARIMRQKGHDVFFTSYSDDYQSYLMRKAIQMGRERFEIAGYYSDEIASTLAKAKISIDWFMKSGKNPFFQKAVQFFYESAVRKQAIGSKTQEVPYSEVDHVYGYEGFASATCNFCGSSSDASQCEACGYAPEINKMGKFTSILSGTEMTWRSEKREYLNLSLYKEYILNKNVEKIRARPKLQKYIKDVLEKSDLDWCIDRPGECGIDVNYNGKNNTIHTWFSGIAGYLASTNEYDFHKKRNVLEEYWKSNDTKLCQFLGFDCSFSHAIVYPALLSNHDEFTHDHYIYTNEFLKLEGKDFSTSRGHAIWINDFLNEYSVDAARFYLAIFSPEDKVTNFELEKFKAWNDKFYHYKDDIIVKFSACANKTFNASSILANHLEIANKMKASWKTYTSLENFSMKGLATELFEFMRYIHNHSNGEDFNLLLIFTAIAKSICPDLSEELLLTYSADDADVIEWLEQ